MEDKRTIREVKSYRSPWERNQYCEVTTRTKKLTGRGTTGFSPGRDNWRRAGLDREGQLSVLLNIQVPGEGEDRVGARARWRVSRLDDETNGAVLDNRPKGEGPATQRLSFGKLR